MSTDARRGEQARRLNRNDDRAARGAHGHAARDAMVSDAKFGATSENFRRLPTAAAGGFTNARGRQDLDENRRRGKGTTMSELRTNDGDAQPLGLIGGIGLTEVHVYAQRPAPDGLFSGCPHVHAVVDEGYFVLQGTGRVEFHDLDNGLRTMPLVPGQYVHFPPMVMHRLVSDGDLIILGMMGSAGLAERGEARIYFGREADESPERFAELLSLPKRLGLEGALQRRDAAVAGYQLLIALWTNDRDAYFAELARFFDVHCRAMATKAAAFAEQIERGPLAWSAAAQKRLGELPARPTNATDVYSNTRGSEHAFGMCGVLRPILKLERFLSTLVTPR
ncbi:cupin domain-containing protein [bacterium]|nr:MAG: cupin domain-containing protein [bacterium]